MRLGVQDLLRRAISGSTDDGFLQLYWRKKTLLAKAVFPELEEFYGITGFLNDYLMLNKYESTLLVIVDAERNREFRRPPSREGVERAIAQGIPIVLQALLLPEKLDSLPQPWAWFIDLHRRLCEYLLPGYPPALQSGGSIAAVDFFLTTGESSTGGHYDTGDVFYFVLEGERHWTVELCPDEDTALRLAAEGVGHKSDRSPQKECMEIWVEPGDCLYVPPYTYHRVRSRGRSLAVSLGLPTFNEFTLLRSRLIQMQNHGYSYRPLPSFPVSHDALFSAAREEVRSRVWEFLGLDEDGTFVADGIDFPLAQKRG